MKWFGVVLCGTSVRVHMCIYIYTYHVIHVHIMDIIQYIYCIIWEYHLINTRVPASQPQNTEEFRVVQVMFLVSVFNLPRCSLPWQSIALKNLAIHSISMYIFDLKKIQRK